MRSYGQYCAVAKSLDVLGDRWTLLIVRELLLAGPSRYTDLRNGLPGIATNLLSERLRALETAGVVSRTEAPPPIATTLFALTERGQALHRVLEELGLWGVPYMTEGPAPQDAFRAGWLAWPAEQFLSDSDPDGPPLTLELQIAEGSLVVESRGGVIATRPGPADDPDLTIAGDPHPILGLLSGHISPEQARGRGVRFDGDETALERLRPAGPPSQTGPRAPGSLANL